VWSYDRRGHGDSGDGAGGSLERGWKIWRQSRAAAGPEVHLVGHSYGAVVCLEAAAHQPGLRSLVFTSCRSTPTRNWMRWAWPGAASAVTMNVRPSTPSQDRRSQGRTTKEVASTFEEEDAASGDAGRRGGRKRLWSRH
jgi:pimeloyl-ACP methyl ester carboxylesterase